MKLEARARLQATSKPVEAFFRRFDPAVDYKSREKVIAISIADFLRLAKPGSDKHKEERVADMGAKGDLFELPYLVFYAEGEEAKCEGHEGRHRARYLQSLGYKQMPCVLKGNIRWSEQTDPNRFDYRQDWPTRIESEAGNLSLPFPVPRADANRSYTPCKN